MIQSKNKPEKCMIRFECPRCHKIYEVKNDKAGFKTSCAKCGQRLQVPSLSPNRTILAPLVPPSAPTAPVAVRITGPIPPAPSPAPVTGPSKLRMPKRRFIVWSAAGVFAAVGTIVLLVILLKKGAGKPDSNMPGLQGNEQQLVKDYLLRNADDPSGLEIAEWGEPRFVRIGKHHGLLEEADEMTEEWKRRQKGEKQPAHVGPRDALADYPPGVIMHARYRMKNRVGAKILKEQVFLIQEGQITRSALTDQTLPRDRQLEWAVAELGGIAAERVGEKLTKVIVRGKITFQGKPLETTRSSAEESVSIGVFSEGTKLGGMAMVAPPRYEIAGLPPGQYKVVVTWRIPNPIPNPHVTTDALAWPRSADKLGAVYSPNKTPLTITVTDKEEVQSFDFDLKGDVAPTPLYGE